MQKKDIAQRIHQEAGISEKDAATLLDWFFELLKTTLQQGESLNIAKFGVFTVRSKSARRGRNPRTGEDIIITPRRVVVFRASAQLKTAVSG
jgi:integration host factor subunit alpha